MLKCSLSCIYFLSVDNTIDLSKNLNSKHMDKHSKRKASPFFNNRIRASAIVNTRPAPGLHVSCTEKMH